MRNKNSATIVFTLIAFTTVTICRAQPATQYENTNLPAPMNWTAEQDHRNMMEQLGMPSCSIMFR